MSRKLVKSKGVNLERQLDSAKIKSESDDLIEEGTALQELAERFNADKNKLEDEIEKVEKSPLSAEDKKLFKIFKLNTIGKLLKNRNRFMKRWKKKYS